MAGGVAKADAPLENRREEACWLKGDEVWTGCRRKQAAAPGSVADENTQCSHISAGNRTAGSRGRIPGGGVERAEERPLEGSRGGGTGGMRSEVRGERQGSWLVEMEDRLETEGEERLAEMGARAGSGVGKRGRAWEEQGAERGWCGAERGWCGAERCSSV